MIPVPISDVLSILNLPASMETNSVFEEHGALVCNMMLQIMKRDEYDVIMTPFLPKEDPHYVPVRMAYSFLLLSSAAEFINLKTIGEGIVKSVGLDTTATQLLTGSEIDDFKDKLELRALTLLREYLNPVGLDRLSELKPRLPRVIRIGVI